MTGTTWTARVRAGTDGPARAQTRGHDLLSDSPLGLGRRDRHPSSLDLLLAALGSDLVLRLQAELGRTGLEVQSLELSLRAELEDPLAALGVRGAEGSPALAGVSGSCYLTGFLDEGEDETATACWQAASRTSPLLQTLRRACPVNIELKLI
ncbi:MAG: OsmC family protein [Candidatus Delongbacteria bacterium]